MIKFNLQHFAVDDIMFDALPGGKKKKKTVPKLPTATDVVKETPKQPETKVVGSQTLQRNDSGGWTVVSGATQPTDIRANPNYRSAEQREQNKAQKLEESLIKQTEIPKQEVREVQRPDYSSQISAQNKAMADSLVAQLKQRIADSIAGQQRIIQQAPQQFDPMRAQSEVAKSQQLRSALERSSVLGDRGGIGRSEALATQTAGEKRLTDINLAQQNVIDQANFEIASLEREGRYEEARIREAQKAQELSQLLAEQQRQDELSRADTLKQEELNLRNQELERQQFIDTISRFGQDYTAEINRVANDGDPRNDWQLPLLETARQDKITSQGLDPATGQPLPQAPDTQAISDLAQWKVRNNIPLTAEEAQTLGVNPGYRAPTTSTGGGLSSSSQASLAKWKVDNGIPLNASEARILGVDEGYIAPTNNTGFLDDADAVLNPVTIETISDNKKQVLENLINNSQLYEGNPQGLLAILEDQGITVEELEVYEDWRDRALASRPFE